MVTDEAAGEIIPVLEQENIDYSLDSSTGRLKVPAEDLHRVRILLASQGLPKADNPFIPLYPGAPLLNKFPKKLG